MGRFPRQTAVTATAHPFFPTPTTASCASSSWLLQQQPQHLSGAGAGGGAGAQRILHLLDTRCSSASRLRQIQAQVVRHGLHRSTWVASAFIGACKDLRHVSSALLFFRHIPGKPHVYVCNSLLRAVVHPPFPSSPTSWSWSWSSAAFPVYAYMLSHAVRPNNYTFPLVLKSLSDLRLPRQGLSVHAHVVRTGHAGDIYVRNSLLNLYSSCGEMSACRQVFDEMRLRDPVSWTTVIEGYRKAGRPDEALITFERMQIAGAAPNRVTMVNALAACAGHGDVAMGVWIHERIRKEGWELDVVLGTSLVDMYGKCGRVEDCLGVFFGMDEKNVCTWNALIGGLAMAKSGEEALTCFSQMEKEGVEADAVTLVSVLCACSHSGLVDVGRRIFRRLLDGGYGFPPGIKHYGCMVDMLGRAGLLEEAVEFVEQMPLEPNEVVYGSLLGALICSRRAQQEHSSSRGDDGRVVSNNNNSSSSSSSSNNGSGRWSEHAAARKLLELEPHNGAYHVLLSNLYASRGRWSLVEEVRRLMTDRRRRRGAAKEPVPRWVGGSFLQGKEGS